LTEALRLVFGLCSFV